MNENTTKALALLAILAITPHECVGTHSRIVALAAYLGTERLVTPTQPEFLKGGQL